MTEIVTAKVDEPIDPNVAAKQNAHLMSSGKVLKAGAIPDSQALGDRFGHVPPPKGANAVGTGTVPAVDDTTLTQMPHPATLASGVPNAEPFGREMNHPGAIPGKNFVRDPAVYATDPTPRSSDEGVVQSGKARPLSKASAAAPENKST